MNGLLPKLRSTALVAAITVVLLEIALQVFYRISVGGFLYERMAIPIYVSDPHRCYAVAPNLEYVHHTHEYEVVYRTDEHNFRVSGNKSLAEDEKSKTGLRVLMLGPSFAFGWANDYEDSFAAQITRRLDGSERPAELLNLGTPGQQIGRQLCWVQNQAAQFRPDLIIQTVYGWLGSIATSCDDSDCPMVLDGFLLSPHANWRQRLSEHSKRSAIVFYSWYLTRRIQIAAFPDAGTELPTRVANTDLGSIAELERRYRSYLAFMHGALGPDVPVVLVFIPYAYAVRPSDSPRWGLIIRPSGCRCVFSSASPPARCAKPVYRSSTRPMRSSRQTPGSACIFLSTCI